MEKKRPIYNPWMDIASYKLEDANKFKGREEDIEKFSELIDSRTMSVLYANSGIGKTSFINAGIVPLYKEDDYYPIHISFVFEELSPENFEEWIVNQLIASFEEQEKDPSKNIWASVLKTPKWHNISNVDFQKTTKTLWWFLHSHEMIDEETNIYYKPLIIFDQFEEVFSKTNNSSGNYLKELLFKALEELSSNAVPRRVKSNLEELRSQGIEIDFNRNIEYKVVFSLRKEYLSDFDYWTNKKFSIAELFRNRMYLLPLTRIQAERVITEQMRQDDNTQHIETLNPIKDVILDKIVDKVSNEVEPLMLSVLCSRLYDKAIERGKDILTTADVEEIKMDTLIRDFYVQHVTSVITNIQQLSELERQILDIDNHRNRIRSGLLLNGKFDEQYDKKVGDKIIKTSYKKELEDKHIIRIEKYNGEDYVELIHDRVAEIISERKNVRKRRLANLKKLKSRYNLLTIAGRRLMDNCGFNFTEDNSRTIVSGTSKNQLRDQSLSSIHSREYDGSDNVFIADILNQTVNSDKLFLHFNESFTKDGFKALGIRTLSSKSQRIINGIEFYGSKECDIPICSAEGFNGIHIDFDSDGNEKMRVYSHSKDGINVSGVTCYEIVESDADGFPLKILFKDANGILCKHFDGNYGIEFKYDQYGNEEYRRYLDKDGKSSCKIYNQVCGLKSEYEEDRVVLQYFVDEKGKITTDTYGIVGVKYSYDKDTGEISSMEYIGKDRKRCINPYGYSVVKFVYRDGKRYQNRFYAEDGETLVNRIDRGLSYSILDIIVDDKCDRIKGYILRDVDEKVKLKIVYIYNSIGHVTNTKYYAEDDSLSVNPSGIHHIKYDYYENGLLKCQSHLGINECAVEDVNGNHKVIFEWDEQGRLYKRRFFKSNNNNPYNSQEFTYISDAKCIVKDTTYIDAVGNFLEEPVEEKQEWIINHQFQAKEIIFGKENGFIPGTPVRVKYKYNIAGDVIEYRFFDIGAEMSIPDEDGDFGYQIDTNKVTGEICTKLLDRNGKCSKNKHSYAIIVRNKIICQGEESDEEAYYDENNKPVLCELGYHRIVSWKLGSGNAYKMDPLFSVFDDELYRFVEYFGCDNKPCDCVYGYSKQQPQKEQKNDTEIKITVSFWGADGSRRINKELGFHKREQIISTDKEMMEISRSFKDENDNLINVREGFAKQTCKLYDSLWTYFRYPFSDHKVIRFYDRDNKKVDVNFGVNNQTYHAYKYVISLDWSHLFKVKKAYRQTLHRDLFRYLNTIWIPFYIVLLVVFPFYILFKRLYCKIKPPKKVSSRNTSIIKIEQVFDKVSKGRDSIVAPSKSLGVVDGCWIVKWNNWVYNKDDVDTINLFEEAFKSSGNNKSITIYNPSEQQFFNLKVNEKNLGLRIHDALVNEESVNEMMEKALSLPLYENAELLKVLCSNLGRLYMERGENSKAEKFYRMQKTIMEVQKEHVSLHNLAHAYHDFGVFLFQIDRNNEAIEALEHALKIIGDNEDEIYLIATIHNHLAQIYQDGEDQENAEIHKKEFDRLKEKMDKMRDVGQSEGCIAQGGTNKDEN